MWVGVVVLFAIPATTLSSLPGIIAGNLLGMADGPTWRPKPTGRHWLPCPALEHGTWLNQSINSEDIGKSKVPRFLWTTGYIMSQSKIKNTIGHYCRNVTVVKSQ